MKFALILHNIRSTHNAGSLFRTADAAGVSEIILTGYTPTPLDRFGRPRSDVAKVALGAEKSVPWRYSATLAPVVKKLKSEGFHILALEQHPRSVFLFDFVPPKNKPLALVVGNEVRGLSPDALRLADDILEIPMRGSKESLNVSVAAGVALYSLMKP